MALIRAQVTWPMGLWVELMGDGNRASRRMVFHFVSQLEYVGIRLSECIQHWLNTGLWPLSHACQHQNSLLFDPPYLALTIQL